MITYKTFSVHRGVTPRGMAKGQEEARAQAKAFIASQLDDSDVIAIAESSIVSTWSRCLVSVTVWYREG